MTATQELIDHHVEEEEEDLFPKVEKKVDEALLKEMGKRMEARFNQAHDSGFDVNVPAGCDTTSSDLALVKAEAEPAGEPPPAAKSRPAKRAPKKGRGGAPHARA